MAITRAQLAEMDEKELREQVLIPLFKAMGYQDVYLHHGGVLEQGKDIVMWKQDDIGGRVNYGVVAKSTRISGSAAGKSGAGEVNTQILQCFGKSYADPVTTEEQWVGQCFVISSKEITKEAINALQGLLRRNNLDKMTRFIDCDTLWELIEIHLPEWSVLEKLQQVQVMLDEASPHYRIVSQTTADRVILLLEPKSPDTFIEHPAELFVRFFFPDTSEGQEMLGAYQRHISTGSPVVLTQPYIDELILPDFLTPFLDPAGEGIGRLELGPRRSPHPLLIKVRMECDDGEKATLEYIHLVSTQAGEEEMTYDNNQQPVPWKFRLTFTGKDNRLVISYTLITKGANIKLQLDARKFQQAYAKGGVLIIESLDTGLEISRMVVVPDVQKAPDPYLIKLLEMLVLIQHKSSALLSIPDREINKDELRTILRIAHLLENGQATLDTDEMILRVDKDIALSALEAFGEGRSLPLEFRFEETNEIFGVTVPLGEANLTCENVFITGEDLNILRAAITATKTSESIQIRFRSFENSRFQISYPKWLPVALEQLE